ncbi:ABC transporter ATP-binding protein [Lentilactobacillus laojiaonis]|uniref:ABC transporter ATP-binding protein n=1 Tax=Lentilactobacillus laojiaonis TaxID=2883998 RepID=UPI001D0BAE4E|nr:ATP-binding cassette domain-containing protein [Lentilactobacillus laojiaonis]UDM32053.1 ATP-binding cassette domain-containing protein [Lentilactobacillus laojiaonis]
MATVLDIRNITYQVEKQTILNDINWQIEEGSLITVTGPSGSGKSTLMRIIANLQPYSSGEIIYQGKSLDEYDPIKYRQQVSYAFQQPDLFGQTVEDNLRFPYMARNQSFDQNRAYDVLQSVDLSKDYLTRSIDNLSGGEKQRVALIRNIIIMPKVLILDEVTTGLDDVTKTAVRNLIKQVNQSGVTVLQVTHDDAEIKNSDMLVTVANEKLTQNKEE